MAKGKGRKAESAKQESVEVPEAAEVVEAPARMRKKEYRGELGGLQVDLFRFQEWVSSSNRPAVILLEGLGPAGKAKTACSIIEGLHKRVGQVVTLEPPGKRERGLWHFQRYVERFPPAGKIVVFDGSWYHYPALERALGACIEGEFANFLEQCAAFEQTLVDSGFILVKYWFAADDEEQDQRFRAHIADLRKHKRFYMDDAELTCPPVEVGQVRDMVLAATNRPSAPWYVIPSGDKWEARLNCLRHLISLVPARQSEEITEVPEA
jgi:polyphosphate kinase